MIEALADMILFRGIPENIRSDNGPEFVAKEVRQQWLAKLGTETLYIEPGSPWENGYCESFNGTRSRRQRSRSRLGDATTTPSDPIRRSDIGHQRQKHFAGRPISRLARRWRKRPH